jgi:glutaminyl-tRNA synthetase
VATEKIEMNGVETRVPPNFIRTIVAEDVKNGKNGGKVLTRFPPEPNGYLHIGHAKSICLNFGLASEFGGLCNFRFDDTNPGKEEIEYVDSIMNDVRWLGFDWQDRLYHASDYFERLYQWALDLIKAGKAYVDSLSADQIREYRGTLTEPGKESPHRNRSVSENLDLFERMRAGEFADGEHVLRAKIDMASPNLNLRDPVMYRIRHLPHWRTGDKWCIYPMYDYAHGQSDALEGITHSICTMEYEDHRALYDWYLDNLDVPSRPRQYEFARLNLGYTVMSKRKLLQLVQEGYVAGWDDPRMPTLAGMRRRGYPAEAIRNFCERIGVGKRESMVDYGLLEYSVREVLNLKALRMMSVLRPLKVVIENYPEGQVDQLEAINNPEDASSGVRSVPFSKVIYIERDDFMENPPKQFFRLSPGREVRLRYAYFIKCVDVVKDEKGEVTELRCVYDPATRGGDSPDGRKVKATLHWVSAAHAVEAEIRLYNTLLNKPEVTDEGSGATFRDFINPRSLEVIADAKLEPALAGAPAGTTYQFERLGYFCVDPDSRPEKMVFNRTVTLRDTWAKVSKAKDLKA